MEGLVYKGDLLSVETTVMSMVDELMRCTLGDQSLTWLDGQVRNIPASEVSYQSLRNIYYRFETLPF